MSVIVTDSGFASDDWTTQVVPIDDALNGALSVDVPSDTDPATLAPLLDRVQLIRVDFPASADGRGFTIGRQLRRMGFTGRLRAAGHVIADQYTMARRSGFDEVEIDDALAARQPEDQWRFRADWQAHDYRARLKA